MVYGNASCVGTNNRVIKPEHSVPISYGLNSFHVAKIECYFYNSGAAFKKFVRIVYYAFVI